MKVENRIGEWIGPHTVISYDYEAKILIVQKSADAHYERYGTTQVKPFMEPTEVATEFLRILHYA